MNNHTKAFATTWGRGLSVSMAVFIAGSLLIAGLYDHVTPTKEVFYSWLLVFFNAYIGTFIANQALKRDFTGFLVWAFLINALRIGIFLIALWMILKSDVLNDRVFASITLFGYLVFLGAEIYSLHTLSLKMVRNEQ